MTSKLLDIELQVSGSSLTSSTQRTVKKGNRYDRATKKTIKMNRGGRGRGGRGRVGRGGRGCGRSRGVGSSPGSTNKRKGLCAALGEHVFTYNEKGAADQMRTTLK